MTRRRRRRHPFAVLTVRSSWSVAIKVGQGVLGALATIVVARWLGPAEYGRYAVSLSLAAAVSVLLAMGLPQLVAREVAVHEARGEWALRRGLLRCASLAAVLPTVVALPAVAVVAWVASLGGTGLGERWLVLTTVSVAALLVALRVPAQWLSGRGRVIAGQFGEAIAWRGTVLVLAGLALAVPLPGSAITALSFHVLGLALALALTVPILWRGERGTPRPPPAYATRRWLSGGAIFMGIAALHMAMQHADILMLGWLAGAESAGIYGVCARIAEAGALVLIAVEVVLAPRFARLNAMGRLDRLRRLAVASARILSIPMALLLLATVLQGERFLALIGPEFASGGIALVILIAGHLVNVACGSVTALLAMAGFTRDTLAGVAVGAAANVSLNALLIPPFGLAGAALATAMGLLVWNILLAGRVRRRLGFDPTILGRGVGAVRGTG